MFHRVLVVLITLFSFACIEDSDPVATHSTALATETTDFPTLFNHLIAVQRSTPTDGKIGEDPASVITYSSLEDLTEIEKKVCYSSKTETATCSSTISAQQGWLDRRNDGCTKRQYCKLSGSVSDLSVVCRTCMTCCDVRNGQTTCRSSCTGEYVVA